MKEQPIDPEADAPRTPNSISLRAVRASLSRTSVARPVILVQMHPHPMVKGCLFDAKHARKIALDLLDMADRIDP